MATNAPTTETRTTWTIDPAHSTVGFSAKHMMFTTVRGSFKNVSGTIIADESNHANSSVDVEIEASSIDTGNEQRDGHVRSADFLDVENYPTISFKSTGIDVLSEEHLKLTGDLTLRGVTHPVTLNAEITGQGKTPFGTEVTGVSLTGEISRKDWGLVWNVGLETGGVLVSDKVKIDIEVQAVKQS